MPRLATLLIAAIAFAAQLKGCLTQAHKAADCADQPSHHPTDECPTCYLGGDDICSVAIAFGVVFGSLCLAGGLVGACCMYVLLACDWTEMWHDGHGAPDRARWPHNHGRGCRWPCQRRLAIRGSDPHADFSLSLATGVRGDGGPDSGGCAATHEPCAPPCASALPCGTPLPDATAGTRPTTALRSTCSTAMPAAGAVAP